MEPAEDRVLSAVQAMVDATSPQGLKDVLRRYRTELSTGLAIEILLRNLEPLGGGPESTDALRQRLAVLEACRDRGLDQVLVDLVPPDPAIVEAVERFVGTASWAERRHLLEAASDALLSEDADEVMGALLSAYADDAEKVERIAALRQVLEVARAHGVTEGLRFAVAGILGDLQGHGRDPTWRESALRMALDLVEAGDDPNLWVQLQVDLAASLLQTEGGVGLRDARLEEAIDRFLAVVGASGGEEHADRWGGANLSLSEAYRLRVRGDPEENLAKALRHAEDSLRVWPRERRPYEWAQAMHNIGTIHSTRSTGDRADNLERAIGCFRQALEVPEYLRSDEDRGLTEYALAGVLVSRVRGARMQNLLEAIRLGQDALPRIDKGQRPVWWGECNIILGMAYDAIADGTDDAFARCVEHLEAATEVFTREKYPDRWGLIQSNLAGAYGHIEGRARREDLVRSAEHAELALSALSREGAPYWWAISTRNLAAALLKLGETDQAATPERALGLLDQALGVFTAEAYPTEHRITQGFLGHAHFQGGRWEEALAAYRAAIESGELLFGSVHTETGRRLEATAVAQLHARAAYCEVMRGRPGPALLELERGKTRLLAESLALRDLVLQGLPPERREILDLAWQPVRELEQEMRSISWQVSATKGPQVSDRLRAARVRLTQALADLRRDRPDLVPEEPDESGILRLAPEGGAIVAPLVMSDETVVFVFPSGLEHLTEAEILRLPGFDRATLHKLLIGGHEGPGWLNVYLRWRQDPGAWDECLAGLDRFTGAMWDGLMEPVHERLVDIGLEPGADVIVLPHAGLGTAPLHAAWREEAGVRRAFLDDYTVTFAPSASVLRIARERMRSGGRRGRSLLLVVDPTNDLAFTEVEADLVSSAFAGASVVRLEGPDATRKAVLTSSPGVQYLHMASHGVYDWVEPVRSALVLAGGERLTLGDALSSVDLGSARLLVLSACETGLTDVDRFPDEYLGLPAGFLQAGTPAVIATLWAVDDLSTALLVGRFYRHHLVEGLDPATALRAAQRWLRDSTASELADGLEVDDLAVGPRVEAVRKGLERRAEDRPYQHPFYWAAFAFTGS